GILLISDKGFASKAFERSLSEQGITLLRPSRTISSIRDPDDVEPSSLTTLSTGVCGTAA
ncbi:hypothetical protein ACIQCF_38185, partial [Streptomyces sp. NPDC088353]